MVKVLLTDDHELYLEGLGLLLNKQPGINVVAQCANGKALLETIHETEFDVLLLDLSLPDIEGEELIKRIREKKPDQKIVYLTMMRGTRHVHKVMKHGVQGYLLKTAPLDELKHALMEVVAGRSYYSKEIDISDNDQNFRMTVTIDDKRVDEILSKREIEIMKLICHEFSNSDIAAKLFLSVSTVETHRKNIISKLGVNNTVGLVKFALKNNIIA